MNLGLTDNQFGLDHHFGHTWVGAADSISAHFPGGYGIRPYSWTKR